MKTPKGFVLKKVKMNPKGTATVSYLTSDDVFDAQTPKHGMHEDGKESIEMLKYALIAGHNLDWRERCFPTKQMNALHTDEEKASMKTLQKYLDECHAEVEKSVQVTGFVATGEGKNKGVIVTGKLTVKGKEIGIASRKFLYEENLFGFEEKLELDVDAATHEVEAYLFQGKVGELIDVDKTQLKLDMPDGEQDIEEPKSGKSAKATGITLAPRKKAASKK